MRAGDGDFVFASPSGRPLDAKGVVRYAWGRVVEMAGIAPPLPRLHDTRHASATHALAAGLSAWVVARLLGHADAGLAWRRYGHALPDEVAGAGMALELYLGAAS